MEKKMTQSKDISLSPKESILIKGAKVHNLKNISLAIPRNKFVVITGLSGSGNRHWPSTPYMLKVNGVTLRVSVPTPGSFWAV